MTSTGLWTYCLSVDEEYQCHLSRLEVHGGGRGRSRLASAKAGCDITLSGTMRAQVHDGQASVEDVARYVNEYATPTAAQANPGRLIALLSPNGCLHAVNSAKWCDQYEGLLEDAMTAMARWRFGAPSDTAGQVHHVHKFASDLCAQAPLQDRFASWEIGSGNSWVTSSVGRFREDGEEGKELPLGWKVTA